MLTGKDGRGYSVMWGIYEYEDSVHVIPCDNEGEMRLPHIGGDFCPCWPEAICFGEDGRYIVNHNEVN